MDKNSLDGLVTKALEEALFDRILRRVRDAGVAVAAGAGAAGDAVIGAVGEAAVGVRDVADAVGNAALAGAKEAAAFVDKYPGVLAVGALIDPPMALLAISAMTAKKIVEYRRTGGEPVSQLLFRVPESLRDEVKRLAVDEKKQMDELLIESVVDLLSKYGRPTKLAQVVDGGG